MGLSDEEMGMLKEAFDKLDEDGTGSISADNLKGVLGDAGFNVPDADVGEMVGAIDTSGSGNISWDEFVAFWETRPIKSRIEARLKSLFEALDVDGTGEITVDNLKEILQEAGAADALSEEEIEELISRVDAAGDGKVSFEEFLAAFMG